MASFESNYKLINEYKLDQLNWFDFYLSRRYNNGPIRIRGAKSIDSDELVFFDVDIESTLQGKVAGVVTSSPANMELSEVVVVEDAIVESDISKEILNKKSVKPRTNFAETAFFYPQLKTDAQGNVQFSFTAPESLTRWNVKLLAHTQDLYFGVSIPQLLLRRI